MSVATTWRENTRIVSLAECVSWQSTSATANDWSCVSVLTSKTQTHSCVSTSANELLGDKVLSLSILLSAATTASTLPCGSRLNNFLFNEQTHRQKYHIPNKNNLLKYTLFCWHLSNKRPRNENHKEHVFHMFFNNCWDKCRQNKILLTEFSHRS